MSFIPFVDLRAQYNTIKDQVDEAIFNVIERADFIGGKEVELFESKFAEVFGVKHCISVGNGTDSLYIILKMLGIGYGDEVITVANSWISSSETISQLGARPIFVDIDEDFYSINEKLIEQKITKRTKAIVPVHLYGQCVNLDAIIALAKKYSLYVIEDCAQSHFSRYNGKLVGTFGVASSFSFYPGKNLGAYGDAGCILTDDAELANKFRMFARHGALKKHNHIIEGINSRMDTIQAAVLLVKLNYIKSWTEKRIRIANQYTRLLHGIPNIILPKVRPNTIHTFHLYVIRAERRDELKLFLSECGIETAIHYPCALPNLKAYEYLGHSQYDYPVASCFQSEIISLPIFPELKDSDIELVAESIKSFYKLF